MPPVASEHTRVDGAAWTLERVQRTAEDMLSRPLEVRPLRSPESRGRTHLCIDQLGGRYVAKVLRPRESPEHDVLRFLAGRPGIVVPEVVGISEADTADFALLIQSELPGRLLAERLGEADAKSHERWGCAAGELLRSLHGIHFESCGDIAARGIGVTPVSVHAWLRDMIHDARRKCEGASRRKRSEVLPLLHLHEVDRAAAILAAAPPRRPCFVHGDFSPKNIIVLDEPARRAELLGVIDVELAKRFDGAFDACRYLIESHEHESHCRAFWRAWTAGRESMSGIVAAYVVVEVLLHFGWAAAHGRDPQHATTRFIERFRTVSAIRDWLQDALG